MSWWSAIVRHWETEPSTTRFSAFRLFFLRDPFVADLLAQLQDKNENKSQPKEHGRNDQKGIIKETAQGAPPFFFGSTLEPSLCAIHCGHP